MLMMTLNLKSKRNTDDDILNQERNIDKNTLDFLKNGNMIFSNMIELICMTFSIRMRFIFKKERWIFSSHVILTPDF